MHPYTTAKLDIIFMRVNVDDEPDAVVDQVCEPVRETQIVVLDLAWVTLFIHHVVCDPFV